MSCKSSRKAAWKNRVLQIQMDGTDQTINTVNLVKGEINYSLWLASMTDCDILIFNLCVFHFKSVMYYIAVEEDVITQRQCLYQVIVVHTLDLDHCSITQINIIFIPKLAPLFAATSYVCSKYPFPVTGLTSTCRKQESQQTLYEVKGHFNMECSSSSSTT